MLNNKNLTQNTGGAKFEHGNGFPFRKSFHY